MLTKCVLTCDGCLKVWSDTDRNWPKWWGIVEVVPDHCSPSDRYDFCPDCNTAVLSSIDALTANKEWSKRKAALELNQWKKVDD